MAENITGTGGKPHPENWTPVKEHRREWVEVEEVVDTKTLKHSGLLVKVRYDGGRLSTWLHSKDFKVYQRWSGGTAALVNIYA